jgi:hypothetical protein
MRWCLSLLALSVLASGYAADWLAPGVHELATARTGISCTLVVPTAVGEAKPLPVLFVVAQDGKPDAKRWHDWGERRNCLVAGINGFAATAPNGESVHWRDCMADADAAYAATLMVLKRSVPVHPFLRFIVGATSAMPLAVAITRQPPEPFGGMLLITPRTGYSVAGELRKDIPLVLVVPDQEAAAAVADKISRALIAEGGTARTATYDGDGAQEPSFDIHVRAMDWLMNIARASHGGFSARERKANLEEIAKQAQELPGLVDAGTRRECAGFLMSVPGMDTLRREYERLADVWVESAVEMAKAIETKDVIEAHEFLSVLVKGKRYQDASIKQQKVAQAALAKLRKNPAIKQEIAASDLVADTCAMLDHDDSPAKQRIALKDLQAVLAQYPGTHAAAVAARLVSRLQQNLR